MGIFTKKTLARVKFMGTRALLDYEAKDKAMQEILPFIDMD